jgi:hypothetical protein
VVCAVSGLLPDMLVRLGSYLTRCMALSVCVQGCFRLTRIQSCGCRWGNLASPRCGGCCGLACQLVTSIQSYSSPFVVLLVLLHFCNVYLLHTLVIDGRRAK